jgi:hypothetical protein
MKKRVVSHTKVFFNKNGTKLPYLEKKKIELLDLDHSILDANKI